MTDTITTGSTGGAATGKIIPVGLDLGFGHLKVAAGNPARTRTMPSVFVKSLSREEPGFQLTKNKTPRTYHHNDGYYLVGDDCLGSPRIQALTDTAHLVSLAPVFLAKIWEWARSHAGDKACVVIGLPWEDFGRDDVTADLRAGIRRLDFIESVSIFPQGAGVLNDVNADGNTIIVDGGYNTLDLVFHFYGRFQHEDSTSLPGEGIKKIEGRLSKKLKSILKLNFELGHDRLIEVLKNGVAGKTHIEINGQSHDLTTIVQELAAEYAAEVGNILMQRYPRYFAEAQRIVLAGGGAYFLKGLGEYIGRTDIQIPDRPEFSNARGFWKKALITTKKIQQEVKA